MSSPGIKSPAWRLWAAERIGVAEDASAATVRGAVLSSLQEADFQPSRETRAAIHLRLADPDSDEVPRRPLDTFQKARRQALREATEQFAQNYWALPPDKRQEIHARLLAATGQVPLVKARLEELGPGLSITAVSTTDADRVRQLAVKVQDLFVLTPPDRAVRRHELVEQLRSEEGSAATLQQFANEYPDLAQLARYLDPKAVLTRPRKKKRVLRRTPVAMASVHEEEAAPRTSFWSNWNLGGTRVGWFVVWLLISGLGRLAVSNSSSPSKSYPLTPPRIVVPQLNDQLRKPTKLHQDWKKDDSITSKFKEFLKEAEQNKGKHK